MFTLNSKISAILYLYQAKGDFALRGFWRRNGFTLGYGALLMALLAFALLDAFVIPREESYVVDDFGLSAKAENPQASLSAEITDTSYRTSRCRLRWKPACLTAPPAISRRFVWRIPPAAHGAGGGYLWPEHQGLRIPA